MRILQLTRYSRTGASSRLRSLQYVDILNKHGIIIDTQPLFDDTYLTELYSHKTRNVLHIIKCYISRLLLLTRAWNYDAIWIEKEIFPYLPALAERCLAWTGKSYIVDYDDAIFHNYDLSKKWLIRKLLGKKIDIVMRKATLVLAGNSYLAERAKAAGAKHVEIIPTVVDHLRYSSKTSSTPVKLTIGWIGSPSTQKYVLEIHQALADVCKQYNAQVMLVGATPQIASELPDIDIKVLPWSEESEATLISQMDIGIMPLTDNPWEKGKCGYKLIQYMACGLPVVASPVGVNTTIVKLGENGFLAAHNEQWGNAIGQLLRDAGLRKQMGDAGRQQVENIYSLHAQAPRLVKLFKDLPPRND